MTALDNAVLFNPPPGILAAYENLRKKFAILQADAAILARYESFVCDDDLTLATLLVESRVERRSTETRIEKLFRIFADAQESVDRMLIEASICRREISDELPRLRCTLCETTTFAKDRGSNAAMCRNDKEMIPYERARWAELDGQVDADELWELRRVKDTSHDKPILDRRRNSMELFYPWTMCDMAALGIRVPGRQILITELVDIEVVEVSEDVGRRRKERYASEERRRVRYRQSLICDAMCACRPTLLRQGQ